MARLQGRDEIVVDAPIERMWTLISDSTLLPEWGPPVRSVEILGPREEALGARRRIHAEFDGKRGEFVERRNVHEPGRKIGYVIEEETFGLFRVMTEPGFTLELEPVQDGRTRVVFSFFHDPKGILGRVLNRLVILRQQRKNRLAALASLKQRGERPPSASVGAEPR